MLISVIVPVFNVEPYLDECIKSILNQSYSDIEIILVDDGSTDSSSRICDNYTYDKRVVVVHQQNGGLVNARRVGFLASSGEYITFVDGDDYVLSTRLDSFAKCIEQYFPDIVCSGISFYQNGSSFKKLTNTLPCGYYSRATLESSIFYRAISNGSFFNFGIAPNLVSKCIKRSLYARHYLIDDSITLGEDFAVSLPCFFDAESVCLIENTDYMYRYNAQSITHSYDSALIERTISLLSFVTNALGLEQHDLKKQLNDYACFLLKNVVFNELIYSKSTFKCKKNRLKEALSNLYFLRSLETTRFSSLKDRVFYYLLKKNRFRILLFLLKIKH